MPKAKSKMKSKRAKRPNPSLLGTGKAARAGKDLSSRKKRLEAALKKAGG